MYIKIIKKQGVTTFFDSIRYAKGKRRLSFLKNILKQFKVSERHTQARLRLPRGQTGKDGQTARCSYQQKDLNQA